MMRPGQRVRIVGRPGTVVHVGRKRQGGAWVPRLRVRYDDSGAVRRALGRNADVRV